MNTSDKSAHPAAMLPMLLLALWLFSQAMASAANVTIPGFQLPSISSYAPPRGAVGAKMYANLDYPTFSSAKMATPTGIEFTNSLGVRVTSPVTMESNLLLSFKVPTGAVTGNPTLLGPKGMRLENQARFQVISFTQTPRGVTVINLTQYAVGQVANGSSQLLPSGTRISQGHAAFVSLSLTTTPTPLDVQLVRLTSSGSAVPMLTLRETVGGAVPGTRVAPIQTVLKLDRLTLSEILGAVTQTAEWTIFHRGQDRRMLVQTNGTTTLEERVNGQTQSAVRYQLKEVSWSDNAASVQFALVDANGNSGETQVLHPPFDAFATNHLGRFSFQDVPATSLSTGPSDNLHIQEVVPMFVRRIR